MKHDYLVDRFNFFQLLLQLVVIGLENLNLHVIHVVFAELKHSVTKGISKLKTALYVAFFCLLMGTPYVFKVFLCIFTLKQVTEDQLVFIYCLFRNYQSKRPLNSIIQCECLVDFQGTRCLANFQIIWIDISCESFVSQGASGYPSNK